MSIKEVTKYVTEDGAEFDTEAAAIDHEEMTGLEKDILGALELFADDCLGYTEKMEFYNTEHKVFMNDFAPSLAMFMTRKLQMFREILDRKPIKYDLSECPTGDLMDGIRRKESGYPLMPAPEFVKAAEKELRRRGDVAELTVVQKSDYELLRCWQSLASPYRPDDKVYGIPMDDWASLVKCELEQRKIPHYGDQCSICGPRYVVYRAIGGISLNGKEYVTCGETDDLYIFNSKSDVYKKFEVKDEEELERQGVYIEEYKEVSNSMDVA